MFRFAVTAVVLVLMVAVPVVAEEADTTLTTRTEQISYMIGRDIGLNFKAQGIEVDADILARAIQDVITGAEPLMSDEELNELRTAFQNEMRNKAQQRIEQLGDENTKAGEAFLAANKAKEGVKTTASGLQYRVLTEGDGPTPTADDTVTVNYRGTLIDGTEFDSSYKRGKPATFKVSGVIPGWTEALQMMKVGSKYQLFIPPDLAYGERGAGQAIGPNSTLIFEVELLGIEGKTE